MPDSNFAQSNKLYERRHLGFLVESIDYLVSIINFLGTLTTCIAIASFIGLSMLGPFMASGIMLSLAIVGVFLAIRHYLHSKKLPETDKEIQDLENDNIILRNHLARLKKEVEGLINNKPCNRKNDNQDDQKYAALLERIHEYHNKHDKKIYHDWFIIKFIKAITENYDNFKTKNPRLVSSGKIAFNVGLGVFSAIGLVGTVGFIMGVSTLALLASPLGFGILVLGCLAFISLNICAMYFCREKICAQRCSQRMNIKAMGNEREELQAQIKQQQEFKNLLIKDQAKQAKKDIKPESFIETQPRPLLFLNHSAYQSGSKEKTTDILPTPDRIGLAI